MSKKLFVVFFDFADIPLDWVAVPASSPRRIRESARKLVRKYADFAEEFGGGTVMVVENFYFMTTIDSAVAPESRGRNYSPYWRNGKWW